MLAGLDAYNSTFLSDLNSAETRISVANRELSSGYRVNQASDDPGSIDAILSYQSQIDQVMQIQQNLSQATSAANVADSALSTANNLLDQLTSIAAEGASSTTSTATMSSLGQQVQSVQQELVTLANTTFNGTYVFGGDNATTPPYTFNWSVAGGVVQNTTPSNTIAVSNANGTSLVVSQTAQSIFDSTNSTGTPTAGNIFQNVYALGQALQSGNKAAVQTAATSIQASVVQLGQATTDNGNILNWLQQSTSAATSTLSNLQSQLGSLRDADAAQAATDLSTAETAEQAAIAARGTLQIKSLFSYLG
jgi:flagellar hook-associated protein 3 FlgL